MIIISNMILYGFIFKGLVCFNFNELKKPYLIECLKKKKSPSCSRPPLALFIVTGDRCVG